MEQERTTKNSDETGSGDEGLVSRRDFLDGLGKWSKIVIGATLFGSAVLSADRNADASGAWANRGGGGGRAWANHGGGGGGAWANRGGGGGAAWANHAGGGGVAVWANKSAPWANHGSVWVNRY
jgi:hypothetical protein